YSRRQLLLAAKTGNVVRLQSLLDKGADPNTTGVDPDPEPDLTPAKRALEMSALDWALEGRQTKAVAILLRKRAKLNLDALSLAAQNKDTKPALMLTAYGADRGQLL